MYIYIIHSILYNIYYILKVVCLSVIIQLLPTSTRKIQHDDGKLYRKDRVKVDITQYYDL